MAQVESCPLESQILSAAVLSVTHIHCAAVPAVAAFLVPAPSSDRADRKWPGKVVSRSSAFRNLGCRTM